MKNYDNLQLIQWCSMTATNLVVSRLSHQNSIALALMWKLNTTALKLLVKAVLGVLVSPLLVVLGLIYLVVLFSK